MYTEKSKCFIDKRTERGGKGDKDAERIRDFDKTFDSSAINIFAPVYFVVLRLWSIFAT